MVYIYVYGTAYASFGSRPADTRSVGLQTWRHPKDEGEKDEDPKDEDFKAEVEDEGSKDEGVKNP